MTSPEPVDLPPQENSLITQLTEMKAALERQLDSVAEQQAINDLKELFKEPNTQALVSTAKERMAFLLSCVEAEKSKYQHHMEANNLLKSRCAMYKDQLASAEARVRSLESQLAMQKEGLL